MPAFSTIALTTLSAAGSAFSFAEAGKQNKLARDAQRDAAKALEEAKKKQIGDALIDRLELTEERIDSMISGLKVVSELPDPVGEITKLKPTPSGIDVSKMRVPLGVVGIICLLYTSPSPRDRG